MPLVSRPRYAICAVLKYPVFTGLFFSKIYLERKFISNSWKFAYYAPPFNVFKRCSVINPPFSLDQPEWLVFQTLDRHVILLSKIYKKITKFSNFKFFVKLNFQKMYLYKFEPFPTSLCFVESLRDCIFRRR